MTTTDPHQTPDPTETPERRTGDRRTGDRGTGDRRSADERREQLIDAAVEVIAEGGLARATTRAITDRAGLALGAFHYIFDSKDELLEAVIQRVVRDIDQTMVESAEAAEPAADPRLEGQALVADVLEGFLRRAWPYYEGSRKLQLAQYELTLHALREPAKHHLAVQQYDLLVGTVRGMLEGLTEEFDRAACDGLARYVVATLDGLLLQWLVEQDRAAAQDRLRRYLATLPAIVAAHSTS